jgi:DNA repair protein SbcD/Mre11
MAKFLHIADIHLGFDHYDNRDRTQDFFRALEDVLLKYAVGEQVDFV